MGEKGGDCWGVRESVYKERLTTKRRKEDIKKYCWCWGLYDNTHFPTDKLNR